MTTEGPTYPIPDVVTPVGTVCYQIEIPDDPQHIRTVFGALASLASWFSWARDNAHSGKQLAALYSQMLNTFQECFAMDVRQNPTNPCILEKETAPGVWTPFADLTLCPPQLQIGGSGILWKNSSGQWVTLPSQTTGQPQFDTPFPPPWPAGTVPPGQTAQCLAAANNLAAFKEMVNGVCTDLNAGATALGVAGGVAAFTALFLPVDVLASFFLTLAGICVGLGASAFCATFDSAAYAKYQCILFCRAAADGSFSKTAWDNVVADVNAQFTGGQQTILIAWLNIIGSSGLTRLGNGEGVTSADCSSCVCPWCFDMDFSVSDFGFVPDPAQSPRWCDFGVYSGGAWNAEQTHACDGGTSAVTFLAQKITFPAATFTSVELVFDYAVGVDDFSAAAVNISISGAVGSHAFPGSSGTDVHMVFTYDHAVANNFITNIPCAYADRGSLPASEAAIAGNPGQFKLKHIIFKGTGTNPFGPNNC